MQTTNAGPYVTHMTHALVHATCKEHKYNPTSAVIRCFNKTEAFFGQIANKREKRTAPHRASADTADAKPRMGQRPPHARNSPTSASTTDMRKRRFASLLSPSPPMPDTSPRPRPLRSPDPPAAAPPETASPNPKAPPPTTCSIFCSASPSPPPPPPVGGVPSKSPSASA